MKLLKIYSILGAVVYGALAFIYPMAPVFAGKTEYMRMDYFLYYTPIFIFALLSLLPFSFTRSRNIAHLAFCLFALAATVFGAIIIGERLYTNNFGAGLSLGFGIALVVLYFALCASWVSYFLFNKKIANQALKRTGQFPR